MTISLDLFASLTARGLIYLEVGGCYTMERGTRPLWRLQVKETEAAVGGRVVVKVPPLVPDKDITVDYLNVVQIHGREYTKLVRLGDIEDFPLFCKAGNTVQFHVEFSMT